MAWWARGEPKTIKLYAMPGFELDRIHARLDGIFRLLHELKHQGVVELAGIDDVIAAVTAEATVIDSVEALLAQLKALVEAAGTDPVKIQAALDSVLANTARLQAAVVANTPAV